MKTSSGHLRDCALIHGFGLASATFSYSVDAARVADKSKQKLANSTLIYVNRDNRIRPNIQKKRDRVQGEIMISWAIRGLLIVSGFLASWFVAKDAPQFGIMQMAVTLILIVFIVAIVAFWPERWSHLLNRLHK
jgi:hypothetical protein